VMHDQCMSGLTNPITELGQKRTRFIASDFTLIKHLDQMCDRSHSHGTIEGQIAGKQVSRYVQKWTRNLCSKIVDGIVELKTFERRLKWKQQTHITTSLFETLMTIYPAASSSTGSGQSASSGANPQAERPKRSAGSYDPWRVDPDANWHKRPGCRGPTTNVEPETQSHPERVQIPFARISTLDLRCLQ